ncbi:hypothetical protein KP509_25G062200 [Ceratopteris richardii]|nr:hypothetical protein KP509_25G062200 [Ceratopteris richardii]
MDSESQESASTSLKRSITIPVRPTVGSPFEALPQSPDRKPLSMWPGMYHSPVTDALWKARSTICERLWPPPSIDGPAPQKLITRTPQESRVSIVYGFTSDYILREQYRNAWDECRVGRIMEDLDALAGTIAVRHCSDDDHTTRPLLLVTASVDKIHLRKSITLDQDLRMSGAVIWVGRSSMAIRMEIRQPSEGISEGQDPVALVAIFRFVARDSVTGKAAPVNQLSPQTDEEKSLFDQGKKFDEHQKKRRLPRTDNSVKPVHNAERLKALLAEGRVLSDMPALADRNSLLIHETSLENVHICQPQQRNMHGRIFGGFLMRMAYELAFSTCYLFVGCRPLFVEVDRIDFLKPVDVGDFLRFKSRVLYTELDDPSKPLISIEVVAHVTRPESRTSEVSNTFYFTFTIDSKAEAEPGFMIRKVLPATEEEARRVLERYDADHEELGIFG